MRTYSTAELCQLLEVSKSTLFRWEQEDWFPLLERDLNGERLYTNEHIQAISKKQLTRQFEQAAKRDDEKSLETIWEKLALRKFLEGDVTGLYEMAEYHRLSAPTLRQLLQTATEHYEPGDPVFTDIIDVIAKQSRILSRQ